MRRALILLALAASAPGARADDPPWARVVADRALATTSTFSAEAVGEGGDTPPVVIAYRRVLRRPDAADAFTKLLESPPLAARLYGLCGLRHAAPERFPQAVGALVAAAGDEKVTTFEGCSLMSFPLKDVVRRIEAGEFDGLRGEGARWDQGGPGASPDGRGARAWVDALIREPAAFAALDALNGLGPVKAGPELRRALAHDDVQVRRQALEAVGLLTPWLGDLRDPVLARLRDPDDEVRRLAAQALGAACGLMPGVEDALLAILRAHDEAPAVLVGAVDALTIDHDASLSAVIALRDHPDERVRGAVDDTLYRTAEEHPDPAVRARAAAARREE